MTTFRARTSLALIGGLALATTACGSDGNAPTADADSTAASATDVASADDSESTGEIATVVVTTNILGDVVSDAG